MALVKKNLTIGEYEVHPVPTGVFGLDGGAMFGTVPRILWEKSNPPDEFNRIAMEARALLLKGKDRNILVDCGNGSDFILKYGEKLGPKFAEMYNIDPEGPSLIKSLEKLGLGVDDIDTVLLTHLHFDHCGGGTTEKDGHLVPTFPKAKYFVQKENLATAERPNIREKASYFPANFKPLIEANQLQLLDGNVENLFPGISVVVTHGHTKAQQLIKVSDGLSTLIYCGDIIPTSSHVRLAWVMGYDLDPITLIDEKTKILEKASDEGWHLYFEHDPYCDIALVERHGADFKVKERFSLA